MNTYENNEQTAAPRRSTRQTNQPKYLDDYILLDEIEYEMILVSINDEPLNF